MRARDILVAGQRVAQQDGVRLVFVQLAIGFKGQNRARKLSAAIEGALDRLAPVLGDELRGIDAAARALETPLLRLPEAESGEESAAEVDGD